MNTNCRCGHINKSKDPHPCHGKGHTCGKPAKQRFYRQPGPIRESLAGMWMKLSMSSTWGCDDCWEEFKDNTTPLPLIPDTDPRLHQVCDPIVDITPDIVNMATKMVMTMYDSRGVGLAAPQVGHNIRMIVMDCSPHQDYPVVLINPVILEREGEIQTEEGCLSFPGVTCKVTRARIVKIQAQTCIGQTTTETYKGLWSVCVQHEIDHLDGITFDQRGEVMQDKKRGNNDPKPC